MVLFLVIMFLVVASILLAGLFSRSVSTGMTTINQVKQSKADMLARGLYWRAYTQKFNGGADLPAGSETIDGIVYNYYYNYADFGSGKIYVNVTYH